MKSAVLALLAIGLGTTACMPDAGRPHRSADVYQAIVSAEDARPTGGDELSMLLEGADLDDPFLRRVAVRALGRLENPALSATIARHLADEDPMVRAAAAQALAQSVHGGTGEPVLTALIERVGLESDAAVRGALARALGRLQLSARSRRAVVQALLELSGEGADEPEATVVGVALGFEALVRLSDGGGLERSAADRLVQLMGYGLDRDGGASDAAGHVRALAASTLGRARRLSVDLIGRGLGDPDPEVRRAVVAYLGAAPPAARDGMLRTALQDASGRVATAAVLFLQATPRTDARCELLIRTASDDVPPAVRIPALEALGRPCPTLGPQRARLREAVAELGDPGGPWLPAATALLSLASIDPDAARRVLPPFVEHADAFVRGYAARTAASIRDVAVLNDLAVDPSRNVRAEAISGLFAVEGHELDNFLVQQLRDDDPQLLMTLAGLLEEAPERQRVASALAATFERISQAERETWRDPRMALLDRIAELGDAGLVDRLEPFLGDYDPMVAHRVAELLEEWTGREHVADPEPLPRAPAPTLAERRALEGATLVLHMRDVGSMSVRLLVDQATTNVARLVRLADSGYYDGLTFHRWVPNFVIQGGSPAANEYQGDGPYTRDEVGGMPHWRGTVGLSTRGRDTGDGQIFVNLVDNVRLDDDYTVMGVLEDGYQVLDGVLEGSVIERAEVVRAP